MLTADLVNARRRGAELRLVRLDEARTAEALRIAEELVLAARAHVGETRGELDLAVDAVPVAAQDEKLKAGLAKLVADACTFDEISGVDPPALRDAVFTHAAAVRRALGPGERFDRAAILGDVAAREGTTAEALDRALYADLRAAHLLVRCDAPSAEALVRGYDDAQAQAVLLRAVKVKIEVHASAGATRALFHKLKFLRLLHAIERSDAGHTITVDGPFSLFESVTKYGLQLAMLLPALEGCASWKLEADVRWGAERTPLLFRLEGGSRAEGEAPPLPDEVKQLQAGLKSRLDGWKVLPNDAILELAGVGLCVPDLVAARRKKKVYVEVMGFWSRDAVWRRVELVQRGLAEPIVFCVSSRLRVSEEVLEKDASSALYVYKGAISPREVAARIEILAGR